MPDLPVLRRLVAHARRLAALAVASLLVSGCAAHQARAPRFERRSDTPLATFFPLEMGTVWGYRGEIAGGPSDLFLVARVTEREGRRAILSASDAPLAYEDRGDSVVRLPSGTAVLRAPLAVGTSWPIPDGTARVVSVQSLEVPAGRFDGVVVVEERTSARRVRTAYAPFTGPIAQEVWSREVLGPKVSEHLVSRVRLASFQRAADQARR